MKRFFPWVVPPRGIPLTVKIPFGVNPRTFPLDVSTTFFTSDATMLTSPTADVGAGLFAGDTIKIVGNKTAAAVPPASVAAPCISVRRPRFFFGRNSGNAITFFPSDSCVDDSAYLRQCLRRRSMTRPARRKIRERAAWSPRLEQQLQRKLNLP